MAPRFLVRVDSMKPRTTGFGQAVDSYGRWTPPKKYGGNYIAPGGTTGQYYYCDGQKIVLSSWPTDPASTPTPFKTYSIYYHEDDFYIANGDATITQVGDGKGPQSETGEKEEEEEEEEKEEDRTPTSMGWYRMTFVHLPNYVSHLCYDGDQPKLSFQHIQQAWARMLFPTKYHADILSQPNTYGGLTGDLPLFLALIMYSVEESLGNWALTSLFQAGQWTRHSYPHGRFDRRGMVVRVWSMPPSSNTELRQFENGAFGQYYY